jgi:hypothetical protein
VPARRDFAEAWRDTWITLAQIPVASLLAADYFYQQSVERSATYLTQVTTRLAFARPAGAAAGGPDNVMADVLTEDLGDATRGFVRDMITLPAESASYFTRRLEAMINDVLTRIQPDAKVDLRMFVVNELDKLNRDLSRLREVAGAETARRTLPDAAERPEPDDQHDTEALRALIRDIKAIAAGAGVPPQQPRGRGAIPREAMLVLVQDVVNAALTRFRRRIGPTETEAERETSDRAAHLLLALQNAETMLGSAQTELEDARQGVSRRRREPGRTRRGRR